MQKFSTQPSEDGKYEVIRWDEVKEAWQKADKYPTEDHAKQQADFLNKKYNEELHEIK